MNGAPSSRGLIDCVPFVAELTFSGSVDERIEQLTMYLVASEVKYLARRPIIEMVEGFIRLQPYLDDLPNVLQLRKPS